jgi:hypothetical protein
MAAWTMARVADKSTRAVVVIGVLTAPEATMTVNVSMILEAVVA